MEKVSTKDAHRGGVKAIYVNGELVYEDREGRTESNIKRVNKKNDK